MVRQGSASRYDVIVVGAGNAALTRCNIRPAERRAGPGAGEGPGSGERREQPLQRRVVPLCL